MMWVPKIYVKIRFCSIHLQYESKFFFQSQSSDIYTETNLIEVKPYSTVEKCVVMIFDNEKIQKIKLNCQDSGFVDI